MRACADRGFTLVEVLVALVLVALGAAAVLSALSNGARANMRLEERSYAEWVALNVLTETRLALEPPSPGETTGLTTLANRSWRWTQTVTRSQVPEVLQIDVHVSLANSVPSTDTERSLARVTSARLDAPASATPRDLIWDSPRAGASP